MMEQQFPGYYSVYGGVSYPHQYCIIYAFSLFFVGKFVRVSFIGCFTVSGDISIIMLESGRGDVQ